MRILKTSKWSHVPVVVIFNRSAHSAGPFTSCIGTVIVIVIGIVTAIVTVGVIVINQ